MKSKGPISDIGANVKNDVCIIFRSKLTVRDAHQPQLAVLDHVPVFVVERAHVQFIPAGSKPDQRVPSVLGVYEPS